MDFGLKNINMLSKDAYDKIAEPARDELFVVSSSGFGFPSNNYDDLELGASGTQYTAPANGWVYIGGIGPSFVDIAASGTNTGYGYCYSSRSDKFVRALLPVVKGKVFQVFYDNSFTSDFGFGFIYAEGE